MTAARCSLLAARCSLLALTLAPSPAQNDVMGAWVDSYVHTNGGTSSGLGVPWTNSPKNWIHLSVVPTTSNVFVWDNPGSYGTPGVPSVGPWPQRFSYGNPETHAFTNFVLDIPAGLGNLFCAGHTWLPDGRLFIAGGTRQYPDNLPGSPNNHYKGSKFIGIWDHTQIGNGFGGFDDLLWLRLTTPAAPNPSSTVQMAVDRWYPTVILLSDIRVMVAGGSERTDSSYCSSNAVPDGAWNTYEVFNLSINDWERPSPSSPPTLYQGPALSQVSSNPCFSSGRSTFGEYPRLHLASTNKVVIAGETNRHTQVRHDPAVLTPVWHNSVPGMPGIVQSSVYRGYGSAVWLPNVGNTPGGSDVLLILGGGAGQSVTSSSERFDAATLAVNPTAQSMNIGRMVQNAVLIPDGSVVVVGGSRNHYHHPNTQPPVACLTTEVYTQSVGWDLDADQVSPRMYHSTAALLPSGNLVSSGSYTRTSDWEIYVPRYFTGGNPPPTFAGTWAGPGFLTLQWGMTYTVQHDPLPAGVTIRALVLMRACSTTHHSDFDQRYIELTPQGGAYEAPNEINVTVPPVPNFAVGAPTTPGQVQAMPGYYMAFLVTSQGVPSPAKWVKL
jgi:hypothetical protein